MKQLTKKGATNIILPTDIFPATPVLGESLRRAQVAAEEWLATFKPS